MVRWDDSARKPPELVSAALDAGFLVGEVRSSPLGILGEQLTAGSWVFRPGARVLRGRIGTLVEVLHENAAGEYAP